MTRAKISAGILCLLIAASIFFSVTVDKGCKRLISGSDKVWELYDSGDTEGAYRRAQELEREWTEFSAKASVLVNTGKLAEIDRVCSRIVYLVENDSEELHSELTELRHMAEALRAGEKPSFRSVL